LELFSIFQNNCRCLVLSPECLNANNAWHQEFFLQFALADGHPATVVSS